MSRSISITLSGVIILANTGVSVRAQTNGVAGYTPSGANVQRFYADLPPDGSHFLPAGDLKLSNLFSGDNVRIYKRPNLVRRSISRDAAIAAFLASPEYGARALNVLDGAILYASIPGPMAGGTADFYSARPAAGLPGVRRIARAQAASAPQSTQSPQPLVGARNLPVFGDIKPQALGERAAPATESAPEAAERRIRDARSSFPKAFSVVVGISPDHRQATLYIFGKMPSTANTLAPTNFTVVTREHAPTGDAYPPVDSASSVTLTDKLALEPSAKPTFFCFQYPIVTPRAGAQTDLMVSYWLTPSIAYTHGVAVARTADGAWISIPMSRMERFNKEFRYQAIMSTEVGQPISLVALARRPRRIAAK